MPTPEVRLERLRPDEIAGSLDRAPIAWIPLGALEFHAPHLPNGTDGFTGHRLLVAAAERLGGVVLPWSYLTLGTLALPWSFRYDPELVAAALATDAAAAAGPGRAPRGRPHRARTAGPEPPDQAGLRRGRSGGAWLPRHRTVLPGAERRARDRARDRLARCRGPRLHHGDVVGGGARARPRRHRPPAGRPGGDDRRGLRTQPAVHGRRRARRSADRCGGQRSSPNARPGSCAASPTTRSPTCGRSSIATGRSPCSWRAGPAWPVTGSQAPPS